MAKFKLIPDLESLNLEEETPEFEEIEVPEDIDAAMLLVMESDEEVEEEFAGMDDDDEVVEEIETAVERLENLAEVIREFGISAPMMKAADPYRELVEAGICKSYEELSLESVKDEESEAVATALENTVVSTEAAGALVVSGGTELAKTAAAGGAGLLGGILTEAVIVAAAAALTALMVKVAKSMATHKGALKSVQAKLGAAKDMNDEKFKVQTKKVLSKEEFGKAIKGADTILKVTAADNLTKVAADIEAAIASGVTEEKINGLASKAAASLKALNTADIKDIFGLEVSGEGAGVVKTKAVVSKSSGNLGEKGWSTGDAKAAVDSAIRVTSEGEVLAKSLKGAAANLNKVAGSLKKKAKAEGIDKAVAKSAVANIKKLTNNYKTLVKVAVNAVYKVNGTAVQVAKAALSTEGK
jgi:hypothetical protein